MLQPQFQYGVGLVPMSTRNAQAKPALPGRVRLALLHPQREAGRSYLQVVEALCGEGNRLFVKAEPRPSPAIKINEPRTSPRTTALEYGGQAGPGDHVAPHRPGPGPASPVLGKMTTDVMTGVKGPREALADARPRGASLAGRGAAARQRKLWYRQRHARGGHRRRATGPDDLPGRDLLGLTVRLLATSPGRTPVGQEVAIGSPTSSRPGRLRRHLRRGRVRPQALVDATHLGALERADTVRPGAEVVALVQDKRGSAPR